MDDRIYVVELLCENDYRWPEDDISYKTIFGVFDNEETAVTAIDDTVTCINKALKNRQNKIERFDNSSHTVRLTIGDCKPYELNMYTFSIYEMHRNIPINVIDEVPNLEEK